MNIEIKDVITLDDNNEYVVVSKALFEGKTYYYLVDIDRPNNLMFCYEDNNELVESVNKELNTNLLPLFYEASKNMISEVMSDN